MHKRCFTAVALATFEGAVHYLDAARHPLKAAEEGRSDDVTGPPGCRGGSRSGPGGEAAVTAWPGPLSSPPTPLVPFHCGWRAFYILIFSWCLLTDDEALAAPPVPDES